MKRRTIVMTMTAALLLMSGAAWTMRPGQDGLQATKRGDVIREVVSPGVVEASSNQVELGFEIPGRIAGVLVDEGERVKEGQILARLDDRVERARVAKAEAALASAKARRDVALAGSRSEEIRAAESEAAAARATAWEREQWRARAEKLADLKTLAESERDNAKGSAESAQAVAAAAEARLHLVKEGTRSELRRDAIAAVDAAQAELDEAKALLVHTELRAPRDGVILRRFGEPGEHVSTTPPKVVLTMADLDHLQLRVEIDEDDVGRVNVGQRGFAHAEAYGALAFPGRIVRLSRELGRKSLRTDDPRGRTDTRVLEVIFVPDGAPDLPLGLRMDVNVETVARRDVLVVPLAAIAFEGAAAHVAVLEGGEEVKRQVKIGADNGLLAEVTEGLHEGELVRTR